MLQPAAKSGRSKPTSTTKKTSQKVVGPQQGQTSSKLSGVAITKSNRTIHSWSQSMAKASQNFVNTRSNSTSKLAKLLEVSHGAGAGDAPATSLAVDPGFPIGGTDPWGGNLWYGHFLAETYAKPKELGHMGGMCWQNPWICHCSRLSHSNAGSKVKVTSQKTVSMVPRFPLHISKKNGGDSSKFAFSCSICSLLHWRWFTSPGGPFGQLWPKGSWKADSNWGAV